MRCISRVSILIAVVMLLPLATDAAPITFLADLTGASEIPPTGSPGTGQAIVVLDPIAQTLHVDVTFSGLLGTTTASHIHCCLAAPGVNSNVMVATAVPTFPGFPMGVSAGTYDQGFDLTLAATYNPAFIAAEGGTVAGAEAALIAGIEARETYLNIHTTSFPGGEIRGILAVPEPGTLLLLGSGLVGLAGVVWRRGARQSRGCLHPRMAVDIVIWLIGVNTARSSSRGRASTEDKMNHVRIKRARYLVAFGVYCLCVGVFAVPSVFAVADLYVGNFFGPGNEDVLRYNGTTGAFVSTFVPTGSGGLTFPLGGTFGPDGNFYVSNSDADTVLRYSGTTGAFLNVFASGVEDAAGLVLGPDNNFYVANAASPGAVTRLNGTTGAASAFATSGSGGLSDPEGLRFGPDGNLYVANVDGKDVLRFNGMTGAFVDTFVSAGSGGLLSPRDVTFGTDGNLYVTSFGTNQVLRYNGATGSFVDVFVAAGSGGLSLPRGLTFGPDGSLYVGSFGTGDILRYNGTTGALIGAFVAAGSGGLGGPTFLVFHETAASAVPEPGTLYLISAGLAGLIAWQRRPRR